MDWNTRLTIKSLLMSVLTILLSGCSAIPTVDARTKSIDAQIFTSQALQQHRWIHGSSDCQTNTDPAIEVFRFDETSYILRQNKCLNFEAPFIYLLFGDNKVLLLDTGATASDDEFPLYKTVQKLMQQQQNLDGIEKELFVMHSHSHSDHYKGDIQFLNKSNVTLVEPNFAMMSTFFNFDNWPNGIANIDLGNRVIKVIPTPGHQQDAVTVYDSHTKWLLTGDSFYPGYIYVKDWQQYKNSIARLIEFATQFEVTELLGAHIEMQNQSAQFYAIGTTYQPNEASLVLTLDDLAALQTQLNHVEDENIIIFDKFIIAPMNLLQKTLSSIGNWITQ